MGIYQISRNQQDHMTYTQKLKSGQVIKGQILKIYPNHKAQIKLGTNIMIAQFDASLSLGEHYYFYVESVDEHIHLKVLDQKNSKDHQNNINFLMNYLGVRPSKLTTNFLKTLINDQIPFNQKQVSHAIRLLSQANNKKVAQHILKEMIAAHLPLTDAIFQALYSNHTMRLSEQLHLMLRHLREGSNTSSIEKQLIHKISTIIEYSDPFNITESFIKHIAFEAKQNQQYLYHLLKVTGMISQINFSDWKRECKLFEDYKHATDIVPFQLDIKKVLKTFSFMNNQTNHIKTGSEMLFNKWYNVINESKMLSEQNFTLFKQDLNQLLGWTLTNEYENNYEIINNLQNNKSDLSNILAILQTLARKETYKKIERILLLFNRNEHGSISTRDLFLNQLQKITQLLGLSDENVIADGGTNLKSPTIKSLLIQLMNQNNYTNYEHVQQLLHYINGLQLQSVHETNDFIYASIQIPGEKLHGNQDLLLEFEGQKTEDGKVNPNFCRVIFYLDLRSLQETIIDMHIQNRIVSITVFNDDDKVKEKCTQFQPLLKECIKNLAYELGTLSVQPFQHKSKNPGSKRIHRESTSYEGIDYRI